MQRHRYSFFGQKVGIILDSADQTEAFIYMRFLRKKADNSWEKISEREGKSIKINLLEVIAIRDVFEKNNTKWSTVHKYSNESTVIIVENQQGIVNISVGSYNKQFRYPETILCEKLLNHILDEKIIFSTNNEKRSVEQESDFHNLDKAETKSQPEIRKNSPTQKPNNQEINSFEMDSERIEEPPIKPDDDIENPFEEELPEPPKIPEKKPFENQTRTAPGSKISGTISIDPLSLQHRGEFSFVPGKMISKTPKAVSFKIDNEESAIWIPISVIDGLDQAQNKQGLWIKDWFLKKILVVPAIQ